MSPRQPGRASTPPDRLEQLLSGDAEPVRGRRLEPWDEPVGPRDDGLDDQGGPGRHRPGSVPLFSAPESLRSVDLRVPAHAVRGVLVLAVVAVLVLGGRWLWSQRPVPETPQDRVVVSEGAGSTAGPPGTVGRPQPPDGSVVGAGTGSGDVAAPHAVPALTAEPPAVFVHVTGQVTDPGVVELRAGDRVVDAVRGAGGFTGDADQSRLNLARAVVDGEQVWVGRPGEDPPVLVPVAGGSGGAGTPAGSTPSATDAPTTTPLDLNLADQAQLEELPGIGPVTAGRILAWRDEHGRFSSVEELMEVTGIGERTFAQLEPVVSVGG
ncbi:MULTISPECIES: helix-hairpin-helix domain-containing protein [unclassified Ornithinimicrobium]|uniref:helix-hairpin-helix domain-containing protein n=1 Tax=unclassified Ornithinimicrobium TaxID=2615080 RepID=UPI0038540903